MTSDRQKRVAKAARAKRRRDATAVPAAAVPMKRRLKISALDIARAKALLKRAYTDQGRPNPFALPEFPPNAMPEAGLQLAHDSDIVANAGWAGSVFENTFGDGLQFLGYPILAELAQRPEYRMVSERLAYEMTRKFVKFKAADKEEDKSERIKELDDAFKHFQVQERFRANAQQDGFFGRSHLFIELKGSRRSKDELRTPIGDGDDAASRAKIKKGSLQRLTTVEPLWCYPLNYNARDPLDPHWYNPQQWMVMGTEVHASRLLKFVGRDVPDILKPSYAFGGLSMSQMIKPYVDKWLRIVNSVADVVDNFSTSGLKTDMEQQLNGAMDASTGEDFFRRIEFYNEIKRNGGLWTLDKSTEDFFQFNVPLGTLDILQAQAQEHIASITHMPLIILLGIQPAGLNASSEGELEAWYTWVHAFQEAFYGANLQRVKRIIMLHLWGEVDEGIVHEFESLKPTNKKEDVDIQKTKSDMDTAYVSGSILSPEEVRQRIANDPDSPYQGINAEDVPEPTQEEADGLEDEQPDDEGAGEDRVVPFAQDADFHEDDHPRGQPSNSGQFAKGGGGASVKIDTSKMERVGKQMGSNPGGVFRDKASGKSYYVKKSKSEAHARNEKVAAALYHAAGSPTLRYADAGPQHIATEMEKLDKDNASKLSPSEKAAAQEEFSVHAWLANWDAVGLGGDNLGVARGKVRSLDLGGALDYRAQGSPKGKAFGTSVGEFDTLRDRKMNSDAAGVFSSMTTAQIRASARHVLSIPKDKIRSTVAAAGGSKELADKLIARRDDIAQRMKKLGDDNNPTSPKASMVIPAGDRMPVSELNGVKFDRWSPPKDWASVEGTGDFEEPPLPTIDPATKKQQASGVIITEPDGRTWVVQPSRGFGGYEGTFPKGRVDKGLTPRQNAIKEAFEESGLKVRLTGHAGDHEGDQTHTRYYHAVRESGDPSKHDNEIEGVVLTPRNKLDTFLNRRRDRSIVESLAHDAMKYTHDEVSYEPVAEGDDQCRRCVNYRLKDECVIVEDITWQGWCLRFFPDQLVTDKEFSEGDHPRAPDGQFGSGGSGHKKDHFFHTAAAFLRDRSTVGLVTQVVHSPKAKKAFAKGLAAIIAHALELDPATRVLNKDLVKHVVNDFSIIAGVSRGHARETFIKVVEGLISLRGGKVAKDSDRDDILEALQAILEALKEPEVAEDDFSESAHPRGQPDNAGQFASKGGGGGGSAESEFVEKAWKQFMKKNKIEEGSEEASEWEDQIKESAKEGFNQASVPNAHLDKVAKYSTQVPFVDLRTKLKANIAAGNVSSPETQSLARQLVHGYVLKVKELLKVGKSKDADTAGKKALKYSKSLPFKERNELKTLLQHAHLGESVSQKDADVQTILKKAAAPEEKSNLTPGEQAMVAKLTGVGKATPEELMKAKKNAALKLQYVGVPNAPDNATTQKLVKDFNAKYESKELSKPEELEQKVADFKKLQDEVAKHAGAAAQEQMKAQQQKKAQEQQQAAAELAAMPKDQQESYKDLLGLSSQNAKHLMEIAKNKIASNTHKNAGLSPVDGAHILAYSGNSYSPTNKALRAGVMSEELWGHVRSLNKALDKMTNHTGTVYRKADLPPEIVDLYKPGMIVEERGFTSSSIGKGIWHGSYHYEIKSKSGKDISSMSLHSSEREVLFQSGSRFKIISKDSHKIVMEQVE